jgi:hypothetical protein
MVLVELSVPFERESLAEMVMQTLAVDTELREDVVARTYRREGRCFVVVFKGESPKMVRTCVTSFFDMLLLAVRIAERFDTNK